MTSVQFSLVAQLCPTVCNPMDCSTSGFPVHTMTWHYVSLPGGISGKEPTCQCRGCKRKEFDPWIGKILWRREWQLPPVFLPRESHGQRSLMGYSLQGHAEQDATEATQQACKPTSQQVQPWGCRWIFNVLKSLGEQFGNDNDFRQDIVTLKY